MNQINLHFQSNTPCSIFINGNNVGIIDNEKTFFIDIICYAQSLIVSADPITKNNCYISNTFKLSNINNTIISSSQFVKVVPFVNNNYDVIISFASQTINNQMLTVFNKVLNGYSVMVTNTSQSILSIFKNDKNLTCVTIDTLCDINCQYVNDMIIVGAKQKNKWFQYVFDTTSNLPLLNGTYIKVEQTETTIKCLQPLNDFFNHGIVYELNLNKKEVTSYSVFISNKQLNICTQLIPHAFLECIKANNFKKAKQFLDYTLGEIPHEKLTSYFNEIINIYYNCYFFDANQINYTIETNLGFKNYTFTVLNNTICEIEENNI